MRFMITNQAGEELAGYEDVGRKTTALMAEMLATTAKMKVGPTVATEQDGVVTVSRPDGSFVAEMSREAFEFVVSRGRGGRDTGFVRR